MSHEVRRFRLHLYKLTFSLGGGGCHVQNLCSRPSDILNTFLIWCHICGEMRRCFFNKTTGLFQLHLKAKHDFFFQTLTWFLCLNLPRYVSNVCANHRYVRCWHLFWTWHITSHDMRISWLPDGGDGAGVITSHEAAGECKVATTRDVVCSFFPSANSPVSSHPAPRCPAGTPSFPLLPSPDIPSPPAHLFPVSPHKPCSVLCIYQPVFLVCLLAGFSDFVLQAWLCLLDHSGLDSLLHLQVWLQKKVKFYLKLPDFLRLYTVSYNTLQSTTCFGVVGEHCIHGMVGIVQFTTLSDT